jgi:hypothetical protein
MRGRAPLAAAEAGLAASRQRESTKPASSATLKLAWQLFEFEVFFQQFIGRQGKKLNEIALQAGRANYRKSNSWHDQAAKCRTRE